jgi:hypothetical protein
MGLFHWPNGAVIGDPILVLTLLKPWKGLELQV